MKTLAELLRMMVMMKTVMRKYNRRSLLQLCSFVLFINMTDCGPCQATPRHDRLSPTKALSIITSGSLRLGGKTNRNIQMVQVVQEELKIYMKTVLYSPRYYIVHT